MTLKTISQEQLQEILTQHSLWIKSNHKQGERADLANKKRKQNTKH